MAALAASPHVRGLIDLDLAGDSTATNVTAHGGSSNVVVDSTAMGMPGLSDGDFFAGCDVVVSGHLVNQRMAR